MTTTILAEFFERDLKKLQEELAAYQEEATLWHLAGEISNSAGNLTLHLIGNLNHFIGATLGDTGYIRDRDAEFILKNVPRDTLLAGLEQTIQMVKNTVLSLNDPLLSEIYPLEKHGQTVTTAYMLLHLLTHLNYHLGQVNYHRRLIENK